MTILDENTTWVGVESRVYDKIPEANTGGSGVPPLRQRRREAGGTAIHPRDDNFGDKNFWYDSRCAVTGDDMPSGCVY